MKTFTLPQLAEELSLSPKTARAILRKAGVKRPGTRWSWPMEKKPEIKAMLKGKKVTAKKSAVTRRPRGEGAASHAHH